MIYLFTYFLSVLPTRVCMMIQTVTARNWTIRAAQNPASLQASGETWTLANGLFKPSFKTSRRGKRKRLAVRVSCLNGLALVLTSSRSVLTRGHHSDGTGGFHSTHSSLQESFRHVSNRPWAQIPSYLPGTSELQTCRVIFHHVFCWCYKVSGLLILTFLLMLLRQILTDAVAACT